MMKKLMLSFCMVMAIIILSGCTNRIDMKNVHNEPHFAGVVMEVFDDFILVGLNEGEVVLNSSYVVSVSLDVYLADSMTDFMSGDEVVVFYDRTTTETYPPQILTVYAIMLTSPSKTSVWHSTIIVDIFHTNDGHTTGYSFRERSSIDELLDWFTRLTLARVSPQDSESLNIEAFEEVYEFVMRTSEHFSWDEENEFTVHDAGDFFVFHYGRIGNAWYLHFGEVWYEVKNPSNIIFPVKHDPIVFEPIEILEPQHENALPFTPDERALGNGNLVELGCCVRDVMVQPTAAIGANSVTQTTDNFIMTLNSDRETYTTADIINIWGTLEYIGENDTIEIWHNCPFMVFSISDGNNFNLYGVTHDILASSVLQRSRVYHFEYQKSSGGVIDPPNSAFRENFFSEPDLRLPAGEYTITLHGGFGLTESISDNPSGLLISLTITVTS